MFAKMMEAIKEESVGFLFNLEVQVAAPEEETPEVEAGSVAVAEGDVAANAAPAPVRHPVAEPVIVAPGLEAPKRPSRLQYSAPTIDGDPGGIERTAQTTSGVVTESGPVELPYAGTSRNAKCPCGSGKAYKRCHGDPRNV
jgi:preprotein translocase subunit SecA